MSGLLDRISEPADVKALSMEERLELAEEIRERIIEVVCSTGGHLASSLGVVELTIALLSVYDPPTDRIVWDVGHQTYPYKLLTGRADRFDTIRQLGGLSGFPRRDESRYDSFGTGHSSTSISAALGFAKARDLAGGSQKVVAIIGDGAMTGGLALEGLNNLGHSGTDMTVILNDNEMSISRNVGALSRYLTRIITDPSYNRLRDEVWNMLGRIPSLGERMRTAAHNVGASLKKTLVAPGTLFDEFGVRYIGPIPGHDLALVTGALQRISQLHGQVLVHLVTRKGKGYHPAESDATEYHGVSGRCGPPRERATFTDAFSAKMLELADRNKRICAITAAMPDGTGLSEFSKRFPDRFFDVGIAEQHAVTFACGLAFGGMTPVVAIYSTFMQRAVDQVIHDACLQGAPVVIAMDRAGLVGEDGPTHHGSFDISLFRPIPGLRICAPRDCAMLEKLLEEAVRLDDGPTLLRYPRGEEPELDFDPPDSPLPGAGQIVRDGTDALVVAVGEMVGAALEAAEALSGDGVEVMVLDPIWIKPMPIEEITSAARACRRVVTAEVGSTDGGFGEAVRSMLRDEEVRCTTIGLPDSFQPHGRKDILLDSIGLSADGIARAVKELVDGRK